MPSLISTFASTPVEVTVISTCVCIEIRWRISNYTDISGLHVRKEVLLFSTNTRLVGANSQVSFCLCFEVSPGAKPFIWKLALFTCKFWFIYMWIKLISIWKASHQDSLRTRGKRQLRNRPSSKCKYTFNAHTFHTWPNHFWTPF